MAEAVNVTFARELQKELEAGLHADVSEFVALDADELITGAKALRRKAWAETTEAEQSTSKEPF